MIRYERRLPTVEEWRCLRETAGWTIHDQNEFEKALESSLMGICAVSNGRTIAAARVVGDGILCFYFQDLIVHPDFRRRGIGSEITKRLICEVRKVAAPNSFIGMFASKGCDHLYEPYGFICRPNEKMGPGMILVLP